MLALGLGLMGLGTGGIKPCVSTNVGDQFTSSNQHLIERAFSYFYLSINWGFVDFDLLLPDLARRLWSVCRLRHPGGHDAGRHAGLLGGTPQIRGRTTGHVPGRKPWSGMVRAGASPHPRDRRVGVRHGWAQLPDVSGASHLDGAVGAQRIRLPSDEVTRCVTTGVAGVDGRSLHWSGAEADGWPRRHLLHLRRSLLFVVGSSQRPDLDVAGHIRPDGQASVRIFGRHAGSWGACQLRNVAFTDHCREQSVYSRAGADFHLRHLSGHGEIFRAYAAAQDRHRPVGDRFVLSDRGHDREPHHARRPREPVVANPGLQRAHGRGGAGLHHGTRVRVYAGAPQGEELYNGRDVSSGHKRRQCVHRTGQQRDGRSRADRHDHGGCGYLAQPQGRIEASTRTEN